MSTIWRGTQSIVELPFDATSKIGTGGSTRRTFKGTQTAINNKAAELQLQGYETRVIEGAVYTLEATIQIDLATNPGATTEPEPVPLWELVPHPLEQDIMECGRSWVELIPDTVKTAIEAKLKNPQNKSLFIIPAEPAEYAQSVPLVNDAMRLYTMKQMGIDSRRIYTLSLKRSIIVSQNYNLNWSIDNVNYVLSTERVKSRYSVPLGLQSLLPPSSWENVSIYITDTPVRTIYIPFFYGWLEQHPSYSPVTNNRWQVSQEWIFNRYCASLGTNGNGLYDVIE